MVLSVEEVEEQWQERKQGFSVEISFGLEQWDGKKWQVEIDSGFVIRGIYVWNGYLGEGYRGKEVFRGIQRNLFFFGSRRVSIVIMF